MSLLQTAASVPALTSRITRRPSEGGAAKKTVVAKQPGIVSLELNAFPSVQIAVGWRQLVAAYRLVHRRYSQRGLVRSKPDGILYSPEFAKDDSRTLVALSATGEVTATATIVGPPDRQGWCTDAIPWHMLPVEDRDRSLAGVTCLAAADSAQGPKPAAFFALARFLFQYSKMCGYDGFVISIHPRQLRFYGRICPITPLGPEYRAPGLGNAPAVPCRIDLDDVSLSRVPPSVLAWFKTPVPTEDLIQPGINRGTDAFLRRYAEDSGCKVAGRRVA